MLLTAFEHPPEDDAVGAADPLDVVEGCELIAADDEDAGDPGRSGAAAGKRLDVADDAPRSSQP